MGTPYLGDYVEDALLTFFWGTNNQDGASITRATNGTVKIIRSDEIPITTGITDTEDTPDTGIHKCQVDLSAVIGYATGYDYTIWVDGAVIDGQTVNAVLAHFSIENRYLGAVELVTAMKAMTGVTEGGTWTWEKCLKIMHAWIAGNWRLKVGDSTTQQLLDAEDGSTVILEQSLTRAPAGGSYYREITVLI